MWEGEERTGVGRRRENGCGKDKERAGVGRRREKGCVKEKREEVCEGEERRGV